MGLQGIALSLARKENVVKKMPRTLAASANAAPAEDRKLWVATVMPPCAHTGTVTIPLRLDELQG